MGERRVLVIGSQCQQLPPPLSFLPTVAHDLYTVLTAADLGGCVSALPAQDGLLLDPTVDQTEVAIETAFQQASANEATLFLAFIGHGEHVGEDFYLLPWDAQVPPRSRTAIHLVQLIVELYRRYSLIDGLVLLLDTCYSGVAAAGAAARWVAGLSGTLRFELLTAANDRTAADGCFSRNLVDLIRHGLETVPSEYLRCEQLRQVLLTRCPNQLPQLPTYNADEGLYLAKNRARTARRAPWFGTSVATEVERLTTWFQPTPQLDTLVKLSYTVRGLAVVGAPGTGKSALAACLARPEVAEGIVPEHFVQAIVFISERTTAHELALQLAEQLTHSLPTFASACDMFRQHTSSEELAALNAFRREVIGPLYWVPPEWCIARLVFDGLDQLSDETAATVFAGLDTLVTDMALSGIQVIVTSRPETPLPTHNLQLKLGVADEPHLMAYMQRRQVPTSLQRAIVQRAQGNWLVARLLTDLVMANPDAELGSLPPDLAGLYAKRLRDAGAIDLERWRTELRPVVSVLAAAGSGPVLPLPLLCAASAKLGGPERPTKVRDVFVKLGGFVVREAPGTEAEHVGVFHPTFAEYILNPATDAFGIAPEDPHAALAAAIEELAPMSRHDAQEPLHRYAAAREADHLWWSCAYESTIRSLAQRLSVIPAENLARWKSWGERINAAFGPNHPDVLTARSNIASWTGATGDSQQALRLFKALLPDQERVLGLKHSAVLTTRSNIAFLTGATGHSQHALLLLEALLYHQEQILGHDHPDVLTTRANIANQIGATGDSQQALRLLEALLSDRERILGHDHPVVLTTRSNIASWIGATGDSQQALRLFKALLPDMERVLGREHPNILTTRSNIAFWIGTTGDSQQALRLFKALLPDMERVLGRAHPDVLTTRRNIAFWTGETGDSQQALRLSKALLPDQERVLGHAHPDILTTRRDLASWTGETGDSQQALRLLEALLPDQERVLGRAHPDVLTTRANIAHHIGVTGDSQQALRLLEALLRDMVRVLGREHADVLTTRANIAHQIGETRDSQQALRLLEALLPDQERVLGRAHPNVLTTRRHIAYQIGETGDSQQALRLLEALLPDMVRILGREHPKVLFTRGHIAHWTGQNGQSQKALRLFEALLPDMERVLGRAHPDVLITRAHIAYWAGVTGDSRKALRLFEALLPDMERVLGCDHPDTDVTRRVIRWYQEGSP